MAGDAGSVVTIEGHTNPKELGIVLPPEHVFLDTTDSWYSPPDSAYERRIAEQPVSLEKLWYINQNLYGHRDNMRLDSFSEVVFEIGRNYQSDGDTNINLTPKNIVGDPERDQAVARETGVTFVHGTRPPQVDLRWDCRRHGRRVRARHPRRLLTFDGLQ